RVDVRSHRFENVFEVSLSHRRVVWPPNLCNPSAPGFSWPVVRTQERECPIVFNGHIGGLLPPVERGRPSASQKVGEPADFNSFEISDCVNHLLSYRGGSERFR